MSVAAIYELPTSFTEDQLPFLGYEQSADVFVITHMGQPIKRLRRFGHFNWILDDAPIGPQVAAPTGVSAVANSPSSGTDFVPTVKYYVVTVVNASGQESQASVGVFATNDLSLKGNFNAISWAAQADAVEYRVYEDRSGVKGFIGAALAGYTTFYDDNIQADFTQGPPVGDNPFASGNSPAQVTFHESRMWLGRSMTMPNALWASQTDDVFNFDKSRPLRATDAMAFRLRARKLNAIRHLVPMKDLTVFTSDMIFSIRATGDGYLSPTSAKAVTEGHRGAGQARPALVEDVAFYSSIADNSVHTLGYTFEKDGYRGNDISVFASHFFVNHRIQQYAWTDAPMSVLWTRRDDGKLAALTWMREQEVWGWTLCETDGVIESICAVNEDRRDVLYAVVRRMIAGQQRRYVEFMADAPWIRQGWTDAPRAVVLDCAAFIESETPFSNVRRLNWLDGREVVCLADGVVVRGLTIVNGRLSKPLPNAVKVLVVGLPYEARLRTLPMAGQAQGLGSVRGRRQSISNVSIEVMNTGGMGAGLLIGANIPDGERPRYSAPLPEGVVTQTPQPVFTGQLDTDGVEAGDWRYPVVEIVQTDPLPMVVLGVSPDLEMGR